MKMMSSLPDLELYKAAEESQWRQMEALKDVEGIEITLTIQPIACGVAKACDAKGGNPLGLSI